MSEAPPATLLAVVDGLWKSFNGRDWDRFFTLTTADYVARTDPQWPGGGEFRGREQLLGFLEQFLEPWEAMRYERTSDARMVNG
ncbi:MAG: nuclear transport factor 2 family protein, partial [Actinomycetota bacterium]|nr:nuclear transport factor 2 family protein [Actinomycetota bacterium]